MTNEGMISHNFSKAHHMAETFKDIHAALVSSKHQNLSDSKMDPQRVRKLARMEIARKMESNPNADRPLINHHQRFIQERNKDLQ